MHIARGVGGRIGNLNRQLLGIMLSLTMAGSVYGAATDFVIQDIRIQGLQRVSAGTVFNLLPVNVSDTADQMAIRGIIRSVFESGYFEDVRVVRDGGVLLVAVVERPAVDDIEIDGNKSIETDALLTGLSEQGLAPGEIFRRATLERVDLELSRQYVAQGRYGARIDTEVEELPRNRVAIKINIEEGKPAVIRHVNITGNTVFSDKELLENFELQLPSMFSFYTNSDKYSREKLAGDIESLESYYQNRGYVNLQVDSTQVSVSPDKREVFITINLNEGDVFEVGSVELVGELNDVPAVTVESLIGIQPGEVFSRARVTATEELIERVFNNSGYAFASATGIPTPREDGKVDLRFFVDSGKRTYVRRLSFAGNTVTHDAVLRREMRQIEGGWASTALIDLSKVRLERLGYFGEVTVETSPVPGTDDQIDVEFEVTEQPSGSISATFGYAQQTGFVIGTGYQENNVFGSGHSVSLQLSWSQFRQIASFRFFDPYYTVDGVSRGFNIFTQRTNFNEFNLTRFSTDAFGAGMTFGFPIGETRRLSFSGDIEWTSIEDGFFAAEEIVSFIENEGSQNLTVKFRGVWSNSTLNRGLFPTAGGDQSISAEVAIPGGDLQFYTLTMRAQQYFPLIGPLIGRLRGEVSYADSISGTLPFYEHFYAGGFGSVRGFERNTLGPRSTPSSDATFSRPGGEPFGGNLAVEGGAEIVLPVPIEAAKGRLRPVLFVDVGQVYNTECYSGSLYCFGFDWGKLRYSAGISATMLSGFGPISIVFAKTFNAGEFEEEQLFQFELGQTF